MIQAVIKIICEGEKVSEDEMRMKTRDEKILFTRQLIQSFCWEFKLGSLKVIGQWTGNKDHATILHSAKVIKNYEETDKIKSAKIQEYRDKIMLTISTTPQQDLDYLNELVLRLESELTIAKNRVAELQKIVNQ